jgi:hypothetical protein
MSYLLELAPSNVLAGILVSLATEIGPSYVELGLGPLRIL